MRVACSLCSMCSALHAPHLVSHVSSCKSCIIGLCVTLHVAGLEKSDQRCTKPTHDACHDEQQCITVCLLCIVQCDGVVQCDMFLARYSLVHTSYSHSISAVCFFLFVFCCSS